MRHLVKFEFHMNTEYLVKVSSKYHVGDTYTFWNDWLFIWSSI